MSNSHPDMEYTITDKPINNDAAVMARIRALLGVADNAAALRLIETYARTAKAALQTVAPNWRLSVE